MKIFISSKEWFDAFVDINIKYTRCFYYSLDCELYYLEEVSKKISASSIELKRKELVESKMWLKEYESIVNKMKRMNFIQRLLYKRGK